MRRFWDERAREDAYFFVDDRRPYRAEDSEEFWTEGKRIIETIFGMLGVRVDAADLVVDIGCGVGRLTRVLATQAACVYAIDVSRDMLARAFQHNSTLGNVRWIEGDGVSLRPLTDGSVDACVSHVVFQHIPDPSITIEYVREMGRVLRPGGWAAFQVSDDPRVHRRREGARGLPRKVAERLGRRPRGQSDPAWLGSAVDMGELRAAAAMSSLVLERVVGEGTQFCMILARRVSATQDDVGDDAAPVNH